MTADEIVDELVTALDRADDEADQAWDIVVERDPLGWVVVRNEAETWRLALHPGPLPLSVTVEGSPPDDPAMTRVWSVVHRLTSPPDALTVLDLARLDRLRRLRNQEQEEQGAQ